MDKPIAALTNSKRRLLLDLLRDPVAHFPPQHVGDLVRHGPCVGSIADKLGVRQPTASEHLRVLHAAGLVIPTRIQQWTFYRRDEEGLATVRNQLMEILFR